MGIVDTNCDGTVTSALGHVHQGVSSWTTGFCCSQVATRSPSGIPQAPRAAEGEMSTMTFPACPSSFDSRTPTGRVVHRVCLDERKPTYRLVMAPRACRLCQSPETSHANAASVGDTKEPPPCRDESVPADGAPPPEAPSLVRRTLSYAEALIAWTAAGRPERSAKDVEQIFNRFCKPCRWYDRRRQICRGCGCRVADAGFAITNKIKMATEHRPRQPGDAHALRLAPTSHPDRHANGGCNYLVYSGGSVIELLSPRGASRPSPTDPAHGGLMQYTKTARWNSAGCRYFVGYRREARLYPPATLPATDAEGSGR